MEIMRVKTEEELFNVDSENEVIDASPCSVYFGASPRFVSLQSYVSVTAFSCYIENFKFQIDCEEILYFRYCSI
jgi:hypothetical protein